MPHRHTYNRIYTGGNTINFLKKPKAHKFKLSETQRTSRSQVLKKLEKYMNGETGSNGNNKHTQSKRVLDKLSKLKISHM